MSIPLIIPSETQIREFDAKLLLGCVAAERGHQVIVGSRTEMHWHAARLPRGVYVAKDFRGSSRLMFRILRDLGNHIVAWDEEGLVHASDERYYKQRIAPDLFDQVELFLAWGESNARTLTRYPGYKGTPVEVSGNPRGDMMRPEFRPFFADEVAALHARYGRDFILVNTNFGRINHIQPHQTMPGGTAAPKDDYMRASNAYFTQLFNAFKRLLPKLAQAFPERAIVLRPHPSEAHAPWMEAAGAAGNVHVIHEGGVLPWLLAAGILIHNGCTTGMEAAALDRPVIAYRPVRDDAFDFALPNTLSADVETDQGVIEATRTVLAGGTLTYGADREAVLDRTFAARKGPLASERIVEAIAGTSRGQPPRRLSGILRAEVRGLNKRLIAQHIPGGKNHKAYQATRFPGISADGVRSRIATLGACAGRFGGVRVHQLAPNVFELTA